MVWSLDIAQAMVRLLCCLGVQVLCMGRRRGADETTSYLAHHWGAVTRREIAAQHGLNYERLSALLQRRGVMV